jgi:methionyl-tRNA synthetase
MSESEKIAYSDFAKLQIKIGTITAVEIVPDADKLLKLLVDVGEETPRQILSGIREYIADPQELLGRQAPFLVNLAPRMIRGLESNGMILAVGDESVFAFLSPHVPVKAGAPVR